MAEKGAGRIDLLRRRDDNGRGADMAESMGGHSRAKNLSSEVGHCDVHAMSGHRPVFLTDPDAIIVSAIQQPWPDVLKIMFEVHMQN